ncbi:PREDICTED: transposon CACTA, partial [Prunus dulcis]
YLHKLKTYVRNKAHPEGSIAEGVLGDECLIFCSRYLHRVETKFNKRDRNDDGGQPSYDTSPLSIFSTPGRAFGKGVLREMSIELHKAATHYVLQNCDEALPFVQEHKNILIQSSVDNVEESHRLQFSNWMSKRVTELYNDGKVSKQMLSLARGPERRVTYYPGYYISGFRFHTLQRDENKKTQNSGIMVKGENQVDDVPWYGTLVDI